MKHSLDYLLRPKSIAVVGASKNKKSLGRDIFDKLLESDFNGPVYPVNPGSSYIHAVKAWPDIASIPDSLDLVVIVVPKDQVLQVVKDCAEKGVKSFVVITAGFRETGAGGAALEQKIHDIAKSHNMRMVGPNCMGIMNMDPDIRLDATFAPFTSLPGSIGIMSQSGALGQTILEHANELKLGVSMFVSMGNKADVSANDLLAYWQDNPEIKVILIYIESFGNPRKFIHLAKEVSRKKPLIVVKSGRSISGARAATSHTGALAGMDMAFDALFKQCGVIRANSINEMFEYAVAFANAPLPAGNRVAIITNAGGPGIMAADACEHYGLNVIELSDKTITRLKKELSPDAGFGNPVDLLAGASPEEIQFTLDVLLSENDIDAALVIFVSPGITDPYDVASGIAEIAGKFNKPVLGCFMGIKGVATGVEELHRRKIPAYPFPESAAGALSAMVRYSDWLRRKCGRFPDFSTEKAEAEKIILKAVSERREFLLMNEVSRLLECYGIPFIPCEYCTGLDQVLSASRKMNFPQVLKISSEKIIHKTDFGGVKLNLHSEKDVKQAFQKMEAGLKEAKISINPVSFVLQEMIAIEREVIMGINHVKNFGTVIMFGLGGIYVEVLRDVAFRLVPLTDRDAEEMIREVKSFPIIEGVRGEKPISIDFLREMLQRLARLSRDFEEIEEMEINPFLVFPDTERCKAVDARIRLRLQ